MSTLNGVKFRKELVSKSKYNIKCPYPMKPKKITVHETDNEASAINEIRYMNNNNLAVSYHVAVDEKEAVQGLPFNRNGWHSGDGVNGYGNRNTIAVEICRNYDRTRKTRNLVEPLRSQYNKAKENAVKVIAALCVEHGIVANKNNIKQHYDWNGKNCPSKMRQDGEWNNFLNAVIKEYNRLTGKGGKSTKKSTSTKSTKTTPKKKTSSSGFVSIVDYLNSVGEDSSFANRKKLAEKHGIRNYKGTAEQNLKLLDLLKKSKTSTKKSTTKKSSSKSSSSKKKTTTKGDMKTTSLVDYLKSIKVDASFANRKKLAKKYGIKNYKGTAEQNTKLLELLRKSETPTKKSSSKKKTTKPKGDMKTNSIVDYLKSINVDSSFANRKKLAQKYGIKNYTGTPEQNTKLLKLLRNS